MGRRKRPVLLGEELRLRMYRGTAHERLVERKGGREDSTAIGVRLFFFRSVMPA